MHEVVYIAGAFVSDVMIHYLEKSQQLKFENVRAIASGPLLAAVEIEINVD